MKGHDYAKAALDIACWDLCGRILGVPVYRLLGGLFQQRIKAYCAVTHGPPDAVPEAMRRYRARAC